MRLDKYLCDASIGTRSEVKQYIKKGLVQVNGAICKDCGFSLPKEAVVLYQGKQIKEPGLLYYVLNKPKGVVSATKDKEKTVLDLLAEQGFSTKDVFPVGRLDKDTEGLLLLTNDGVLSHELLSPKKHVSKVYEVTLKQPITTDAMFALEGGVDIGEKETTLPAKVTIVSENVIHLTIREGKFHQIKRMLKAVGNEVVSLKRLRMGTLVLDEQLKPSMARELLAEEIKALKNLYHMVPPKELFDDLEAVIFDVDGTMVDSMWMWKKIDKEYMDLFSLPLPADLQKQIEGLSFYETAVYMKENYPIPETVEEMMKHWNEMADEKYKNEVPLKPGVLAFLEFLKKKNIPLGIATSNSRELFSNLAISHGFDQFFSVVKTGSEVLHGKPAPDIYLAVAEELKVNPQNVLVFEDVAPGLLAARRAGMKTCSVQDTYSMDMDAEKIALSDYYIRDFREMRFV